MPNPHSHRRDPIPSSAQGAQGAQGVSPRHLPETLDADNRANSPNDTRGDTRGDRWRDTLRLVPGGTTPIPDLANIRLTLTHCPFWSNLLAFNSSSYQIEGLRLPPFPLPSSTRIPFQWVEHHDIMLLDWLQHQDIPIQSLSTISQAVGSIARENHYHPIRDYFSSLRWDLYPRIGTWLNEYLGVPHDLYSHAVGRVFLVAAVTRVFEPGSKYDYCLVLEGPQGTRKSTALRTLASPWFAESAYQLGSLNSILSLRGVLLMELPELSALDKVDVGTIKQSLSCQIDRVRPPYGRHVIDLPRESVFVGTSNHDTYLHDETGNRRFLPVRTGQDGPIRIEELERDKDQIWAEAVHLYHCGTTKCYLESEHLARQADREQRDRYQPDPWEDMIGTWLRDSNTTSITADKVLDVIIKLPVKERKHGHQLQVARCLRGLGWERHRDTGGKREWIWTPKPSPVPSLKGVFNQSSNGSRRVGVTPEEQDYEE